MNENEMYVVSNHGLNFKNRKNLCMLRILSNMISYIWFVILMKTKSQFVSDIMSSLRHFCQRSILSGLLLLLYVCLGLAFPMSINN